MTKLAYDVGVNTGTDTAYYLREGYRVVGIEANPDLVRYLERRFRSEIEAGQLTLLCVGIAAEAGELEFWICDDKDEWSSFDKEIASRNGARHHSVRIPTLNFRDVLVAYGMPNFCKIDIEGNDSLCLNAFTSTNKPDSISIEMIHSEGVKQFQRLQELGYSKFKIISQSTWSQPSSFSSEIYYRAPDVIRRGVRRFERTFFGVTMDGDWKFEWGSSGAFGEKTSGSWRSYAEILAMGAYIEALWQKTKNKHPSGGDWYDIHATI